MKVISRSEAKEQGLTRYFTGKPCKKGHVAERYARNGECLECAMVRPVNIDVRKKAFKKYYEKNSQAQNIRVQKWRSSNRNKMLEAERAYASAHPGWYTFKSMKYHASKLQRTPKWADFDQIKKIYETCDKISAETGILHHVDHYYPLQGKTVSGLHVHMNLRIIPAKENLSKNNKHPDEL